MNVVWLLFNTLDHVITLTGTCILVA
uniref:Uncharacterized protein n=1 Tax=Arundo donax TaxID=35708 RepID=A0A0A9DPG9_ARUDO